MGPLTLASARVVGDSASPAYADVGPVHPVTVDLNGYPANNGSTMFVRGDVYLAADESEGTVFIRDRSQRSSSR